jgi:hypothetical protein
MVRTQIQLSEDEVVAVKRLARERSVSMAAVIRDAVDQRSLAAVGGFHSGGANLSATHDDAFAAAASE